MSTVNHTRGETMLVLSKNCVEVLETDATGARVLWSASFASDVPGGTVLATLKALSRRPTKFKRCVLVLGPPWLEMRTLSLPRRPKREMNRILQRKAAALLGCEIQDAFFSAVSAEERQHEPNAPAVNAAPGTASIAEANAGEELAGEEPWLLLAMRRSRLVPLLLGLRAQHISVRRTVSLRLALQGAAWSLAGRASVTCLSVAFEKHAVAIGVVHDGTLRYHNVIEGNLDEKPALAMMLLQEFKSTEAWWRKSNRGGKFDEVILMGLGPTQGELLERATRNALPGASVRLSGGANLTADPHSALLEFASIESPMLVDVSIPLPWRKRTAITAALIATLATAIAGLSGWMHFQDNMASAEQAATTIENRLRELDTARVANQESRAALARRVNELAGFASIQRVGLRFEDILDSSCASFGDRAALLRIAASRDGAGTTLEVAGRTTAAPLAALAHVERIRGSLLAAGLYTSVVATPEESGPANGSNGEGGASEFRIRAPLTREQ